MEASETIEKPAKKTYIKHKTEKKVGISFYLNTKLKPKIEGDEELFPIYCRISYNGTDTKVKSELASIYVGTTINEWADKSYFIHSKIEKEKLKKTECFNKILAHNDKFEVSKINSAIELYECYSVVYEKDFTIQLYENLNSYITMCSNRYEEYLLCKKNGISLNELYKNELWYQVYEINGINDMSPEIVLDIISKKYPILKQFLINKFPSKIWRLKELISIISQIYNDEQKNEVLSWHDIENGRFRKLLETSQNDGILKLEEIEAIFNDLSKIEYLNDLFFTYELKLESEVLQDFWKVIKNME